ncbi:SRPBCC family protein [Sphaerisporangium flaviroseum]|uniref:SRPBCC family protein n=1 Tax=Sphaerisporangium flaviroseum TaxID=509199 RepID=A0ABP7HS85_9ACTN
MPEIATTATVNARPEEVWALLRDFNGLGAWHPAMPPSVIEEGHGPEAVGAVRRFEIADGSVVRERLTAFSDADRSYSYTLEETALPMSDYHAMLAVSPAASGGATIKWSVSFNCPPEEERHLEDFVRNVVFGSGMVVLKARFQ